MRSFTGWVALMMNCERLSVFPLRRRKNFKLSGSDVPYLLGDLSTLLGSALVASAAGSGVLLWVGLSILLSSLLRMWYARVFFFFCALREQPLSRRRRSGAAKRDTYRSLHHFVGIEVIWGRRCGRDRGDAKRWVSYVVLNWKVFSRGGLRSRFRSASSVGRENVNLGAPAKRRAERSGAYVTITF